MHLLALHGFTGRGADFAPLKASLGGLHAIPTRTIDWLTPDLPGHGPEPQLDCSPEATLSFLNRQHSRPDSHRIILGYSMGARAAMLHATANPDCWDAVVLISPNAGIVDEAERAERRKTDAALAARIERDGLEAFLDYWSQQALIRSQANIPPPHRQAMRTNRLAHTAAGLAASLRQFGQGSFPNLWPELEQLTMPILLLSGQNDEKYGRIAARMQSQLRSATHVVIPNAGHAPHLEATPASTVAIHDFIKSLTV